MESRPAAGLAFFPRRDARRRRAVVPESTGGRIVVVVVVVVGRFPGGVDCRTGVLVLVVVEELLNCGEVGIEK